MVMCETGFDCVKTTTHFVQTERRSVVFPCITMCENDAPSLCLRSLCIVAFSQ